MSLDFKISKFLENFNKKLMVCGLGVRFFIFKVSSFFIGENQFDIKTKDFLKYCYLVKTIFRSSIIFLRLMSA